MIVVSCIMIMFTIEGKICYYIIKETIRVITIKRKSNYTIRTIIDNSTLTHMGLTKLCHIGLAMCRRIGL